MKKVSKKMAQIGTSELWNELSRWRQEKDVQLKVITENYGKVNDSLIEIRDELKASNELNKIRNHRIEKLEVNTQGQYKEQSDQLHNHDLSISGAHKWVKGIGLLLGVVGILVGIIYTDTRKDIADTHEEIMSVATDVKNMTKDMSVIRQQLFETKR